MINANDSGICLVRWYMTRDELYWALVASCLGVGVSAFRDRARFHQY